MFDIKSIRRAGIFTLFFFVWFCFCADFNFAQKDDDLLKARRLYQQGDYEGAILLLTDFINKIKAIAAQKKNLAEAFYLLAKVYYTVGEDEKVDNNLNKVFENYPNYSTEETDLEFKDRVEKVRAGMAVAKLEPDKEAAPQVVDKKKPEEKKVIIKPAKKKKKKFPIVLVLVGAVAVGAILYFLVFKKDDKEPEDTRFDIRGTWEWNWTSTDLGTSGYYYMTFTGSKANGIFTRSLGGAGTYTVSTNNYVSIIYNNISLRANGTLQSNTSMNGDWDNNYNYGTWYADKLGAAKSKKKDTHSKHDMKSETSKIK